MFHIFCSITFLLLNIFWALLVLGKGRNLEINNEIVFIHDNLISLLDYSILVHILGYMSVLMLKKNKI